MAWHNQSEDVNLENAFLCQDITGDVLCENEFVDGDLTVCTVGSFSRDKLGFFF